MFESLTQTIPNLTELKEQYKQRLDAILYKQLTPDNIETFADEALDELVALNDEILSQYRSNPNIEPNKPDPLFKDGDQEDDAYQKLQLPNIQEILERVVEVQNRIHSLRDYIEHYKEGVETIITPPQQDYGTGIRTGNGLGFEQKVLVPRLLTLLYLLEADLNIKKDEVKIVEGKVPENAVRKHPYVRVEILKQRRVVYLCDEEDNASYVFDTEKLKEAQLTIEDIDVDDKRDKNSLIAMHPGIGARIIQTKNWRENMFNVLSESIPEKTSVNPDNIEAFERQDKRKSEFLSESKYLPWQDFKTNLRQVWIDEGKPKSVKKWYAGHAKCGHEWPYNPYAVYANYGFNGLNGVLDRRKLLFVDFKNEVRNLYAGEGDARKWYDTIKDNHPNWPSAPDQTYAADWVSWSELVGKENRYERDILPFDEFRKAVIAEFDGSNNILNWYTKVAQPKHKKSWPSTPSRDYPSDWVSWIDLVDAKDRKKDWPSFEDYKREVSECWKSDGQPSNLHDWYRSEKKKHTNWHANPSKYYKNSGWVNLSELVGK